MTSRSLIVARMKPGAQADVAGLFAASDRGELPHALGVTRRHLFTYNGLYFHYVEFDGASQNAMAAMRDRPDFVRLSSDLDPFITPYDPTSWRSPQDALAQEFYAYEPEQTIGRDVSAR